MSRVRSTTSPALHGGSEPSDGGNFFSPDAPPKPTSDGDDFFSSSQCEFFFLNNRSCGLQNHVPAQPPLTPRRGASIGHTIIHRAPGMAVTIRNGPPGPGAELSCSAKGSIASIGKVV